MDNREQLDLQAHADNVAANKASDGDVPPPKEKLIDSKEVETAASNYAYMCAQIKVITASMSVRQLSRVMNALAVFPYGESYPKFISDKEQKLFTFFLAGQKAKAIIGEALKEDMAEIQNSAVDGIVEETQNNLKGESTDGKMD
jgi:hypothetical protein